MKSLFRFVLVPMTLAVAACAPQPVAPVATPSPSPSPSPGASPSAEPTASPSQEPAAPTAAPFSLGQGEALKSYDFNGIRGVYFDRGRRQFNVLDAVNENAATPGLQLRKFSEDGTFVSTVALAPADEKVPDAVDAFTFDLRGAPLYAYRSDETFRLLHLFTATVAQASKYPINNLAWAGPAALRMEGEFLTEVLLSLDVERRDEARRNNVTPSKTDGQVVYARAEEGEAPEELFQVADPLYPTTKIALGPEGRAYLAGPRREGGLAVKVLKADRTVTDFPASLSAVPDGMWVADDGKLFVADKATGAEASMRVFAPSGELLTETPLRLREGGQIFDVRGLTFDADGAPVIAGQAFDASGRRYSGLFKFTK